MTPRAPELPPPHARPDFLRHASTFSKAPSLSPSNEADDEQSMSEENSAMDSNSSPPNYDGEDTRLTSDKELSGFYMYGWAAEVRLSSVKLWPTRTCTNAERLYRSSWSVALAASFP